MTRQRLVHHFSLVLAILGLAIGRTARGASPATQPASSPDGAARVVIDNFTFSPATLTVDVGTKVTWVNHDDVPHTATADGKPRAFNSGPIDTDQSFSFVFQARGSYPYFCAVHPHMTGTIIVK